MEHQIEKKLEIEYKLAVGGGSKRFCNVGRRRDTWTLDAFQWEQTLGDLGRP